MNIIATKGEELQVISLTPFAYMGGKGEKVLQIKVSAEKATFEVLRTLFEGNTEPIEYYEGDTSDALKCEYNGYSSFSCEYKEGTFEVELKKGTLTAQVDALLVSNEKLLTANAMLKQSNELLTKNSEMLLGQNDMLNATLTDILAVVIPDMIAGVMFSVEELNARVSALEEYDTMNDTETGETGSVAE